MAITTNEQFPLVTVVTPTYNRVDYLPIAINSVLNQTYRNLELILVDDGSTDNTREVVEKYHQDSRFQYIYQENRGQAAARNVGLGIARGDFIALLDSDDIWDLNKVERQIEAFVQHPDVGVVYGDTRYIDKQGERLDIISRKRYSGHITGQLLLDNCVGTNTAMFRRECYLKMGGFDVTLQRSEDYDLWLRYSTKYKFLYLNEVCASCRITNNQLSDNRGAVFDAIRRILDNFSNNIPDIVAPVEIRKSWSLYYGRRGMWHASKGDINKSLRDYIVSIIHYPLNKTPWKGVIKLGLPGKR